MERKWKDCGEAKLGCAFCRGNCLTALRANAHELRAFREELAALDPDVQDVHLSWIFHKHPAKACRKHPAKAQLPKRRRAAYCSTANEFHHIG